MTKSGSAAAPDPSTVGAAADARPIRPQSAAAAGSAPPSDRGELPALSALSIGAESEISDSVPVQEDDSEEDGTADESARKVIGPLWRSDRDLEDMSLEELKALYLGVMQARTRLRTRAKIIAAIKGAWRVEIALAANKDI